MAVAAMAAGQAARSPALLPCEQVGEADREAGEGGGLGGGGDGGGPSRPLASIAAMRAGWGGRKGSQCVRSCAEGTTEARQATRSPALLPCEQTSRLRHVQLIGACAWPECVCVCVRLTEATSTCFSRSLPPSAGSARLRSSGSCCASRRVCVEPSCSLHLHEFAHDFEACRS